MSEAKNISNGQIAQVSSSEAKGNHSPWTEPMPEIRSYPIGGKAVIFSTPIDPESRHHFEAFMNTGIGEQWEAVHDANVAKLLFNPSESGQS